ncbi:hypothetical protein [Tolypothrix sp. VBCCA 56010]|uniref:hypothetical protein n=1 Tax=Tolypothrix sp. VBCCA 56010 TaxID=3137731 RepID=UPI003D7C9966
MKPTQPHHRNERRRRRGQAGATPAVAATTPRMIVSGAQYEIVVGNLAALVERDTRDPMALGFVPLFITGAYRRAGKPLETMFSAIELLAPFPTAATGGDHLHATLTRLFVTDPPELRMGSAESGLSRGFRVCTLRLDRVPNLATNHAGVPIRIQRFDTGRDERGAACNFGWVIAMTTGPMGLQAFMRWRWGRVSNGGQIQHNQLVLPGARVVPTPTERDLFHLLRLDYLEPEHRDQWAKIYASELNGFKLPEWARGTVVVKGSKGGRR